MRVSLPGCGNPEDISDGVSAKVKAEEVSTLQPSTLSGYVLGLERVPKSELHYTSGLGLTQWILCRGKVAETSRRCSTKNERVSIQACSIESSKPLSICQVKDFPAESKLVTFPWHVEGLMQTSVEREVPGLSEHVAVAPFTQSRITVALIDSGWIREHVRFTIHVTKARVNRPNSDHSGRDLPVGRPALKCEWTKCTAGR